MNSSAPRAMAAVLVAEGRAGPSLWLKLYVGLVLFAVAGLGAGGVLVDRNVRAGAQADAQDRLSYETTMLGQMTANALFGEIDPSDTSLNGAVRALGKAVHTELAIIANNGVVVADSEADSPLSLPSQLDMPEVASARATGTGMSIRDGRIFVANAIMSDGKMLGVARSSLSGEVIEEHVRTVRRRIEYGALFVIAVIGVLGYAMASRIVSPLRALSAAAQRIGAGDLTHPIQVTSKDEIAQLSRVFNEMTSSLRENIAALDARNRDLRLVLDNVHEGLLTMDREGVIRGERAAVLDAWFGAIEPGVTFGDYIARVDPRASAMFSCAWDELLLDVMPFEVSFDQLPLRMRANDRSYEFRYTVLEDSTQSEGSRSSRMTGLLVTISDVTARIEAECAEGQQRELASAFERIMKGNSGFLEFFAEAQELVELLCRDARPPLPVAKRLLHTLKGNASLFGLSLFASLCHEVEERMAASGGDLTPRDRGDLRKAWEPLAWRLKSLLGENSTSVLDIDEEDHAGLLRAVVDGRSRREIAARIGSLKLDRVSTRLHRAGEQAQGLASRLGKAQLDLEVKGDGLRVSREALTPFWAAFAHVVRNAVDHGIESPAERASVGKPPAARLSLGASRSGDRVVIEVTDDGRGIDWAAVRARAQARGLAHESPRDLAEALFHDGFSTKADVSEVSGRGLGLGAARSECEKLGGVVSVASERGQGATFRFSFPGERVTMLEAGVRDLLRDAQATAGAGGFADAWSETWDPGAVARRA